MNWRKVPLIIFFILVCAFISLYVVFFNHGPPEEILKSNLKNAGSVSQDEDPDELTDSEIAWRKFIKENKYVCIGTIWDACGKLSLKLYCYLCNFCNFIKVF